MKEDVGSLERRCLGAYIEKAAGQECISTTGGGGEPLRKEACVCLVGVVISHSEEEGRGCRSSRCGWANQMSCLGQARSVYQAMSVT